jgi:hypothetical protein
MNLHIGVGERLLDQQQDRAVVIDYQQARHLLLSLPPDGGRR